MPTFPASATSRPAARQISPSSSTAVVFPFVPVTATKGRSSSRQPRVLVLEQAQLRAAVGLERAVPGEVIGREVQDQADLGREGDSVVQLVAARLADDRRVAREAVDERRDGRADVPRERDLAARRAPDLAEQLDDRRLPVRPGDRDERAVEQPPAQFELAADRDARRDRARHDRRRRRHPGALHDRARTLKLGDAGHAGPHLHPRLAQRRRLGRLAGVHTDHRLAARPQQPRRRSSRPREAHHEPRAGRERWTVRRHGRQPSPLGGTGSFAA